MSHRETSGASGNSLEDRPGRKSFSCARLSAAGQVRINRYFSIGYGEVLVLRRGRERFARPVGTAKIATAMAAGMCGPMLTPPAGPRRPVDAAGGIGLMSCRPRGGPSLPKLRLLAIAALALALALAGCAGRIESAYFRPPGALERLIMRHYERYASEGGACFNPFIDGFTRLSVLADTPERLVVQARYLYRDRFHDGGQGEGGGHGCTGFAERTFTLGRDADGAPIVTGMTGEQDEPAIRTLARRLLPR